MNQLLTKTGIEESHERIKDTVHRTPILSSHTINRLLGVEVVFKCENFQKIGAFKIRGASNASALLTPEERARGLATHSSGNHAQAVALSAKMLGVPAYIVMPENAPAAKRAATEGYGAQITSCENTLAARESTLQKVVEETGATFIHPYNDYNVIAGQATCAKELLEDVDGLDILTAPVGGGGLMSGTLLSARYFAPGVKVYGGEPKEVDDAYRSLKSGQLQSNTTINTIADGLRTNLGEKTFDILQRELDDLFLVSEVEILQAMRLIWERMKIIIEPSCAVPLAAILKHPEVFAGKRVGVILTGGNVDLNRLPF